VSRPRPVVTIDGPAGAGKSTVTRRVAAELGYLLLGTGALYRAVALAAQRARTPWSDAAAVGALARRLVAAGDLAVARRPSGEQRVLLEGEDVTDALAEERIGQGASEVSAHPEVRAALLEVQRQAGAAGGIVAEGRDVGTVIFPDAEAKFFLTASVSVRARRRYEELIERGLPVELERLEREVAERDRRDTERAEAPLRCADDAVTIDSSALSVDEVVAIIVERVRAVAAQLEAR